MICEQRGRTVVVVGSEIECGFARTTREAIHFPEVDSRSTESTRFAVKEIEVVVGYNDDCCSEKIFALLNTSLPELKWSGGGGGDGSAQRRLT
jgi:hypothetical protein